jgi:hypothetical protein
MLLALLARIMEAQVTADVPDTIIGEVKEGRAKIEMQSTRHYQCMQRM